MFATPSVYMQLDANTTEGGWLKTVLALNPLTGLIAAFRAAEGRKERFSVVITDLGMPHIDGRKVALAVKSARPSTPVILLTGWGQRLVADGEVPPHVDRVLNKPPKLRELRAALAELVDGSRSASERSAHDQNRVDEAADRFDEAVG